MTNISFVKVVIWGAKKGNPVQIRCTLQLRKLQVSIANVCLVFKFHALLFAFLNFWRSLRWLLFTRAQMPRKFLFIRNNIVADVCVGIGKLTWYRLTFNCGFKFLNRCSGLVVLTVARLMIVWCCWFTCICSASSIDIRNHRKVNVFYVFSCSSLFNFYLKSSETNSYN